MSKSAPTSATQPLISPQAQQVVNLAGRASPSSKGTGFCRLVRQAGPETCILLLATVMLLLSSLANLAIPMFFGIVVDAIAKSQPQIDSSGATHQPDLSEHDLRVKLNTAILELVVIVGISAVAGFVQQFLYSLCGERIVARLRKRLFVSLAEQEVALFDATRTGELMNRLASDTTVLKDAITSSLADLIRNLVTFVGGMAYLFYTSWMLTLIMLAVAPLTGIGGRTFGGYFRNYGKKAQDALAEASEVAEESFGNIRTVRMFSQEFQQLGRYSVKIDHTYKIGAFTSLLYGLSMGFFWLVGFGAIVVVLWVGGNMVLKGQLSVGVLTSFLLYTITIAGALGGISGVYSSFMQAIGATTRVFEFIDRESSIPTSGGDFLEPEALKGEIRFENVSFWYPSRPDARVLSNFSLTFEAGKVTALVGPSGGGKSTVISLIERFYDPDEGSIYFDDKELKSIDPRSLHTHISLVSQEPVLFASSIGENIAYGQENITQEMIERAAKLANAHEFITKFPEGYETLVGERGVRLSGGQKQRIAIARAILLNPRVLLLDEATSALDAESEHLVQEALDRVMEGRTVIVVAHRLSTIKDANTVVVISDHRVAEQGTHQELLDRMGVYAQLVQRQLESLELGGAALVDEVKQ